LLTYLNNEVRILSNDVTHGSQESARKLLGLGRRAVKWALVLGAVGLLAAIGAGLFMLRTLRPLRVLRLQARQLAGGDYGRRRVVPSRDEIVDLARGFDAMGTAIDVRERRLIRSQRLATVGRLAAPLTHETRTP